MLFIWHRGSGHSVERVDSRPWRSSDGGSEETAEEVETDWESGNKDQSQPRGENQGTGATRVLSCHWLWLAEQILDM